MPLSWKVCKKKLPAAFPIIGLKITLKLRKRIPAGTCLPKGYNAQWLQSSKPHLGWAVANAVTPDSGRLQWFELQQTKQTGVHSNNGAWPHWQTPAGCTSIVELLHRTIAAKVRIADNFSGVAS